MDYKETKTDYVSTLIRLKCEKNTKIPPEALHENEIEFH